MVELLLEHLGGDQRRRPAAHASTHEEPAIACYHVDARLSRDLDDIGQRAWAKVPRLLRYCLEAIGCRFRHHVRHFYYVPAPPGRQALYRDWLVMALCRPFYARLILHWHAAGLGDWLENRAYPWERWISQRLLGGADLSIIQSRANDLGLKVLAARAETIVTCGIPDPAANFVAQIELRRRARFAARAKLLRQETLGAAERQAAGGDPETVQLLFLALCTRTKGLFDTLEAVARLRQELAAENSPLRVCLTVAGKFWRESERAEFDLRCQQADLKGVVTYAGFVQGETKRRLFLEADVFCFPTYYESESFGLVLAEAMAFGVPAATTRWRGIPDLFPAGYPGLAEPQAPAQVAAAIRALLQTESGLGLRAWFLQHHEVARYVERMRAALQNVT